MLLYWKLQIQQLDGYQNVENKLRGLNYWDFISLISMPKSKVISTFFSEDPPKLKQLATANCLWLTDERTFVFKILDENMQWIEPLHRSHHPFCRLRCQDFVRDRIYDPRTRYIWGKRDLDPLVAPGQEAIEVDRTK